MLNQRQLCLALLVSLSFSAPAFAGHGGHGGQHRAAMIAAQYDINQDGTVTMDEIQAGRAAEFTQADSNADGQLSVAELQALQAQRRTARQAARFAQLDSNGDGVLSVEEFQAQRRAAPERAANLFGLADTNRDGMLDQNEMAVLKSPQGRVWRKFVHIDSNGDGVISAAEYANALPQTRTEGGYRH